MMRTGISAFKKICKRSSVLSCRSKHTIAVAMSGGIDSAVSALLLKEKGYDCVGVFMKNWDFSDESGEYKCTYTDDRKDMEEVCKFLDIPAVHVDFSKQYWNEVFVPFLQAYETGLETPNPDVYCNRFVKFAHLKSFVQNKLGIQHLATGHYARLQQNTMPDGSIEVKLLSGIDPVKDQTYFLSLTPANLLQDVMFPVGDILKSQVKIIAQEKLSGLNVLNRRESMGICFIGKRPMKDFLMNYMDLTPGRFIDINTGHVLGTHDGQEYFTIGQGAKIGGLSTKYFIVEKVTAYSQPYFTSISGMKGDILVGQGQDHPALYTESIEIPLSSFHWISSKNAPPPPALLSPGGMSLSFKSRHTPQKRSCQVIINPDKQMMKVIFSPAHRALTPGQIFVLYDGDHCLGGVPIPNKYFLKAKGII